MKTRLDYSHDEIMADPEYASRIRRNGVLFHGGLDRNGGYLPPRSRFRTLAIRAWTDRLASEGHPTEAISLERVKREFFPTVGQSAVLLRNGAKGAMTRILTLIGITEGFGNDGIKLMPPLNLQDFFKESIDGTCLAHLRRGIFEAHGNDEAGRGDEAGHDVMWYAIRDAALDSPPVTPDMFENLPIAPPPGYTGPAKPAPEALSVGDFMKQLNPSVDPLLEMMLTAMAQILVIELVAFSTFAWAREVLADPSCSSAPDFAPQMVDYIQADESIHVGYLQCALAEARSRTIVAKDGSEIPGAGFIDAICNKMVTNQMGGRWDRMMAYRMGQIRSELKQHPAGERILAEFAIRGPIPGATDSARVASAY